MDTKRPIVAGNVSQVGHLICKCGRFGVYLTQDGDFKVVDERGGVAMEHLTAADTHDLYEASHSVEEWGFYHHVIKKNG